MKKAETITKVSILNLLILAMFTLCLVQISCKAEQNDDTGDMAANAWELRMNGKADEAKLMLQQYTTEQPDNAMAWYELSRATHHVGLSDPQNLENSVTEALGYIDKAIGLVPENTKFLNYKGNLVTLNFYMNLKFGKGDFKTSLEEMESVFNKTFELDNSYTEGIITLVEFYGGLPEGNGGNKEKAESYAAMLESTDLVAGAKAREILMPEDTDYIEFWTSMLDKAPNNPDAHEALGRVYLFYDQIDHAEACYNNAMEIDPAKNTCLLDMGRYYLMMAMQNPPVLDSVHPIIKTHFEAYLNSTPEPCNPMKAWAYSKLAMVENYTGNTEGGENYAKKANQLDPFHSPAFGTPSMLIYAFPNETVHEQGYYLSPF